MSGIKPILSFTAEEIWQTFPGGKDRANASSVHLASFPRCEPQWIDRDLEHRWDDLLNVRAIVQARLEEKRREKLIGSSLEAKVILHASKSNPMYDVLKSYEAFLPSLFIVSQVELRSINHVSETLMRDLSDGFGVEVTKAAGQKCERCWNYRETVGIDKDHPTLCDRCLEAIR